MLFLSHSSRDKAIVRKLANDLEQAGFTVWLDEWSVRIGECIATKIENALRECRFVLLVLSPQSVASDWVNREWKAKYWVEVEEGRVRVLPVLVETCEVPLLLRTKLHVDLSKGYNVGLDSLVSSLNQYIAEDSAKDFYAYAPVVAKQLVTDPEILSRNIHWDKFDGYVSSLNSEGRFHTQKANSLHYLCKWGLTVIQLRLALGSLGFPTSDDPEFTPDLAIALQDFQRTHCLRHVDGVFGELTYRQMYDLQRQTQA
jgi:hypothetical protein